MPTENFEKTKLVVCNVFKNTNKLILISNCSFYFSNVLRVH